MNNTYLTIYSADLQEWRQPPRGVLRPRYCDNRDNKFIAKQNGTMKLLENVMVQSILFLTGATAVIALLSMQIVAGGFCGMWLAIGGTKHRSISCRLTAVVVSYFNVSSNTAHCLSTQLGSH